MDLSTSNPSDRTSDISHTQKKSQKSRNFFNLIKGIYESLLSTTFLTLTDKLLLEWEKSKSVTSQPLPLPPTLVLGLEPREC